MIFEDRAEEALRRLAAKVIHEGKPVMSRYGSSIHAPPSFFVVKKPEYFGSDIEQFWYVKGESYIDRAEKLLKTIAAKLKVSPFTRRMSIPLWLPKDHFSNTPPALTEVSFLYFNERLNATSYVRSLDISDYFSHDFDLVNYLLEKVCELSGFKKGSIGMVIGCPHIYERDIERVERELGHFRRKEVYGSTKEGTHIVEDNLSSAWHSAVEAVYNGMEKKTEWGCIFSRQEKCRFLPRLFVEIRKPEENQIHDKAPFSKEYGISYAHSYVIHAEYIDKPVCAPVRKSRGEVYTYAERARYCEADDIKVDQLYTCIEKLRRNKYARDCYVTISRPWDLFCDEPPCLRGYQFIGLPASRKLAGIFYMRSNDIFGAMHTNAFAFSILTSYIAELSGFDSYIYYHFANDAHIYGDSLKAAREVLFPEMPKVLDSLLDGVKEKDVEE